MTRRATQLYLTCLGLSGLATAADGPTRTVAPDWTPIGGSVEIRVLRPDGPDEADWRSTKPKPATVTRPAPQPIHPAAGEESEQIAPVRLRIPPVIPKLNLPPRRDAKEALPKVIDLPEAPLERSLPRDIDPTPVEVLPPVSPKTRESAPSTVLPPAIKTPIEPPSDHEGRVETLPTVKPAVAPRVPPVAAIAGNPARPVEVGPVGAAPMAAAYGPPIVFGGAEYLYWRRSGSSSPSLARAAQEQGETFDVLRAPGRARGETGVRLWLDFALDADDRWRGGVSYLSLGRIQQTAGVDSRSYAVLGRGVIDAASGQRVIDLVGLPGSLGGRIDSDHRSEVWGLEFDVKRRSRLSANTVAFASAGYRHLELDERLVVGGSGSVLELGFDDLPEGTTFSFGDRLRARSQFHGVKLGGGLEHCAGKWSLSASGGVALGLSHLTRDNTGFFRDVVPGEGVGLSNGGLLAGRSNLGRFTRDEFAVLPEGGLRVGYEVVSGLRLSVGYSAMYLSRAIRVNDQIDRVVNVSRVGPARDEFPPSDIERPSPAFNVGDLFLHGISFGVEWVW